MVGAIGKTRESIIESVPPPPGTVGGVILESRYMKSVSPYGSETSAVLMSVGGKMYGSDAGRVLKTDSSTPKFLARMDLGV